MRNEWFADILLILLISTVIAVILSLVNRGKRASKKKSLETTQNSAEEGQD